MKKPIPFGKYLLLERVNVGGMAEVYKAKAFGVEGFERLVAVKRILPSIAEDKEFIEMFIDEAKIAVQLTHANIAQIFDLGKHSDSYFIAMEYIAGKDLRAVFDRARKKAETLPIPMACYVVMKLCEGLDYAHNKRDSSGRDLHIIHRDVSPQNILVSYDGEVKIVDFGIAKAANKMGRTQAGILKGKFGYMSPEQVRGMEIDRRSDVFACGIVLYELLTGERLFVGESDFSTLEKVRNVDVMPPTTYNQRIPPELEKIVLRALAKDVEERYQTAMDLHDDLQAFMYASGNFFARKDLSAFMRKTFAEEIARETARDEQYRKIEMQEVTDHVVKHESVRPAASASANKSGGSVQRPPMPPSGGGGGKKPPAPPVAPPQQVSVPPKPPAAAGPPKLDGMDWDDEDAATKLYDRPDNTPSVAPPPATRPSGPLAPPVIAAPPAPRAPEPAVSARAGAPSPFDDLPSGTQKVSVPSAPAVPRTEIARGAEPTTVTPRPSEKSSTPMILVGLVAFVGLLGAAYFFLRPSTPGTIHLTTVPPDTVVVFDEQVVRASSSPFVIPNVESGATHLIEVRKPGYRTWSTQVTLQPGQNMALPEVTLQLESPAAAAAAQTVEVSFDSDPEAAEVFLVRGRERRALGPTPVTSAVSLAGEPWTIEMTLEGYEPWRGPLRVPAGRSAFAMSATLRPKAATPEARPETTASTRAPTSSGTSSPTPTVTAAAPTTRPATTSTPVAPPTPPPPPPTMESAPAASGTGTLKINSIPWSQVYVDNRLIGNTPQTAITLTAGDHRVTLINPDFQIREVLSVHIDPGQTVTRVVRFDTGAAAPAANP
ncbi:MAG: protein kinase [Polyangiales bacterium]